MWYKGLARQPPMLVQRLGPTSAGSDIVLAVPAGATVGRTGGRVVAVRVCTGVSVVAVRAAAGTKAWSDNSSLRHWEAFRHGLYYILCFDIFVTWEYCTLPTL
jgi:hypothetical protein